MKITLLFLLFAITGITSDPVKIYMIGDSTMANKPNPEINPERGWGQILPHFFDENVVVDNRAVNGRSTRSFIAENRWDSVYSDLKKGDYVFIQFGHNDQKENDPARYTNPHTAYRQNLLRFVKQTIEKGATPVLFSSVSRRSFNMSGVLVGSHSDYTLEARLVAKDMNITFIDLEYLSELLEERYGVEKSQDLHLHFGPGENPYFIEGKQDNTHFSVTGATEIAKIVVQELKKTNLDLVKYLKKDDETK